MKKTLAILLCAVLLTACTHEFQQTLEDNADTTENAETPDNSTDTANEEASQTADPKHELIYRNKLSECEAMGEEASAQKDECLLDATGKLLYYNENYKYSASNLNETCNNMTENTDFQNQCFWLFAMTTKNRELCDLINEGEGEYTMNNCKNYISVETPNADWELKTGYPPNADPVQVIYAGSAQLQGWIVNRSSYVGPPESPHFHVANVSLDDLPPMLTYDIYNNEKDFSRDFQIFSEYETIAQPQFIARLANYSEKNPATVKASAIIVVMEGTPMMIIDEIVE